MIDFSKEPLSPNVTLYLHAHVDGALMLVKFNKRGDLWVRYVPDMLEEQRFFSLSKVTPPLFLWSNQRNCLFRRQLQNYRLEGDILRFWTIDLRAEYESLLRGWLYDTTLVPSPRSLGKHLLGKHYGY